MIVFEYNLVDALHLHKQLTGKQSNTYVNNNLLKRSVYAGEVWVPGAVIFSNESIAPRKSGKILNFLYAIYHYQSDDIL